VFGFMKPQCESAAYRRLYARCCQHLRANYGLLALPFHSYESLVLYSALADAQVFQVEALPAQQCCRLRRAHDLDRSDDAGAGRFCSSLSILLADIKLSDDKRDARSYIARGYHWLLGHRIKSARAWFSRFDAAFNDQVNGFVEAHLATEDADATISIEDYCIPTADAFSYVFGLSPAAVSCDHLRKFFATLGREIGTALIAFDCAMDWEADLRSGSFNPLRDGEQAREGLVLSIKALQRAEEACLLQFGPASSTASIASSVRRRIATLVGAPTYTEDAEGSESLVGGTDFQQRQPVPSDLGRAITYSDCLGGGGLGLCLCLLCCATSINRACKQHEERKDPFERDHPCAFGCLKCCCEEGMKEGCKQCR
jgi:hypothetical protein